MAQTRAADGSRDFAIWRDVEGIRWGEAWRERLHAVIGESHLFLLLLSPGWLRSDVCREEYAAVLKREAELGAQKRILVAQIRPIPDGPHLTDEMKAVQAELGARQRKAWRACVERQPPCPVPSAKLAAASSRRSGVARP